MEQFNASNPIYLQLADKITRKIFRGEIDDKLPSIREIALTFGVNPNTVQRTFMELEQMGTIEIRRGLGAFVTKDKDKLYNMQQRLLKNALTKFVDNLQELGFEWDDVAQNLEEYWHQNKGETK